MKNTARTIYVERRESMRTLELDVVAIVIKEAVRIEPNCANCKHLHVPRAVEPCNTCGPSSPDGDYLLWEYSNEHD